MKSISIVQVLLVVLCFIPLALSADAGPIRIGFIDSQTPLSLDVYIREGIEFFIKYANSKDGGMLGQPIQYMEVKNANASAGGETLVNAGASIIISPFSCDETIETIHVAETYDVINMGVCGFDDLYNGQYPNYFSVGRRFSQGSNALQIAANKARTYALLATPRDKYAAEGVMSFLRSAGVTLLARNLNVSKTNSATVLRDNILDLLQSNPTSSPPDLLVCTLGYDTAFKLVREAVLELPSQVFKMLVYLPPLGLETETKNLQHSEGWVIDVPFLNFADSDLISYGGYSKEFYTEFTKFMGKKPHALSALTVANLQSYQGAVQSAKVSTTSVVRHQLATSLSIGTFLGRIRAANASNSVSYIPVQYQQKGPGAVVPVRIDFTSLIYPATIYQNSSVYSDDDDGMGRIVVVVVVAIAGVVIALGLAGVHFIRRQRIQTVQALIKAEEGERRAYKIDFASVDLRSRIGVGSFGYVYSGSYRGAEVAIKKLKRQEMSKKELDDFAREASVMVGLRHPNIILFMGVCVDPPELCIVTELMPRGSLFSVLHNSSTKFPFPLCIKMALDVVKGLQYIHLSGIIHRDLKSPNLLVDKDWNIKIADFGLSCTKADMHDGGHFSLLWTAPEVLRNDPNCYSEKSDIYSLGIILWEIISGESPFESLPTITIMKRVVNGTRPVIQSDWHPTYSSVIKSSWASNPSFRNTAQEARMVLESLLLEEPTNNNNNIINNNNNNNINNINNINDTINYSQQLSTENWRDLPPSPPSTNNYPLSLVFMDIHDSSSLWEDLPVETAIATKIYHQLVNQNLKAPEKDKKDKKEKERKKQLSDLKIDFLNNNNNILNSDGVVVASSGSVFIVSFPSIISALNFCMGVQLALMKVKWPDAFKDHPSTKAEKQVTKGKEEEIIKGMRVKMGLHTCTPTYFRNPLTQSVDYSGPGVSLASRLSEVAQGGQILMVREVYAKVMEEVAEYEDHLVPFHIESLGRSTFGEVFQAVPMSLIPRLSFFRASCPHSILLTPLPSSSSLSSSLPSSPPPSSPSTPSSSVSFSRQLSEVFGKVPWIIDIESINIGAMIGCGSYGVVHNAIYNEMNIALKVFLKQTYSNEVTIEMQQESAKFYKLEHPNVVKFYGLSAHAPSIGVLMEFVTGINLQRYLYDEELIDWDVFLQILKDIASGMEYLSSCNIVHGELKTSNILLTTNFGVKIGDYGFRGAKLENQSITQVCSVAHVAPEVFKESFPSEKSDVYGFGILVWEIVFRERPWDGEHTMKVISHVESGRRPPIKDPPIDTPPGIIKLLQECWHNDPNSWPTFHDVVVKLNTIVL